MEMRLVGRLLIIVELLGNELVDCISDFKLFPRLESLRSEWFLQLWLNVCFLKIFTVFYLQILLFK